MAQVLGSLWLRFRGPHGSGFWGSHGSGFSGDPVAQVLGSPWLRVLGSPWFWVFRGPRGSGFGVPMVLGFLGSLWLRFRGLHGSGFWGPHGSGFQGPHGSGFGVPMVLGFSGSPWLRFWGLHGSGFFGVPVAQVLRSLWLRFWGPHGSGFFGVPVAQVLRSPWFWVFWGPHGSGFGVPVAQVSGVPMVLGFLGTPWLRFWGPHGSGFWGPHGSGFFGVPVAQVLGSPCLWVSGSPWLWVFWGPRGSSFGVPEAQVSGSPWRRTLSLEQVLERDFPFDLTYVTERIICLRFPPALDEPRYRRHLREVAAMMASRHRDHYMIFNLSEKRRDIVRLNPKVQEFAWPDLHAPPLDKLCSICKALEGWLRGHPQNVAVLHCKGSKGKTGVIVAAYMHYSNVCASAEQALSTLSMRKFCEEKVTLQPSQRRYISSLGGLLGGSIRMNSSPLFLHHVLLPPLPAFHPGHDFQPFLKIYQSLQLVYTSGVYSTPEPQSLCITLEPALLLKGDVMVKCYQRRGGGREGLFRLQFHTCTLRGARLELRKDELDGAWADDRFPPDASVELVFSSGPEKIQGWTPPRSPPSVDYSVGDPDLRRGSYEGFNLRHQDSLEERRSPGQGGPWIGTPETPPSPQPPLPEKRLPPAPGGPREPASPPPSLVCTPKPSLGGTQGCQDPPKINLGGTHGFQDPPDSNLGGTQGYQDPPDSNQGGTHGFQDSPKINLGGTHGYQEPPKINLGSTHGYQDAPKINLGGTHGYQEPPDSNLGGTHGYQDAPKINLGGTHGYQDPPDSKLGGTHGYQEPPKINLGGTHGYQEPPDSKLGGTHGYQEPPKINLGRTHGYQDPPDSKLGGTHGYQDPPKINLGGTHGYQDPPDSKLGGTHGYQDAPKINLGGTHGYQDPPKPSLGGTHGYQDPPKPNLGGTHGCQDPPEPGVTFVQATSKFWYKPALSRDQAVALLKAQPPGSFLVRHSRSFPGAFGLAMKVATVPPRCQSPPRGDPQEQLVRHFLIETGPRGVKIRGCPEEPHFGSLPALVLQHSRTPLSLPCALRLPHKDPLEDPPEVPPPANISTAADLLRQGAACRVLFLGSAETESLTGPQAVAKAGGAILEEGGPGFGGPPRAPPCTVHFKVSAQGITLTDSQRRVFFRRHYPVSSITHCGGDPQGRRWTNADGSTSKIFGFVAKRGGGSGGGNICHLFAELDPEQPASAIVTFVTKVLLGTQRK
ncbi:tensin-2 isoform X3 [Cuculus canorus]|uniref:tensin-2 isoform X3 n=1 Tax=Cuculus canorus TaxID=55661 RepID=UPI0023AB39D5|nr:tensin-2 isoform X3 [Cuculus canorus]